MSPSTIFGRLTCVVRRMVCSLQSAVKFAGIDIVVSVEFEDTVVNRFWPWQSPPHRSAAPELVLAVICTDVTVKAAIMSFRLMSFNESSCPRDGKQTPKLGNRRPTEVPRLDTCQ